MRLWQKNKEKKTPDDIIYLFTFLAFKGAATNLDSGPRQKTTTKKQNKQKPLSIVLSVKICSSHLLTTCSVRWLLTMSLGFWKVTVTYCMCSDILARKEMLKDASRTKAQSICWSAPPAGEERLLNYCRELSELNRAVKKAGIDSMASSLWCATGAVLCAVWWTL